MFQDHIWSHSIPQQSPLEVLFNFAVRQETDLHGPEIELLHSDGVRLTSPLQLGRWCHLELELDDVLGSIRPFGSVEKPQAFGRPSDVGWMMFLVLFKKAFGHL